MRAKQSGTVDEHGRECSPVPSENLTEYGVFEVNTNFCTTSPHGLATRIATFNTVTPHSAKEETQRARGGEDCLESVPVDPNTNSKTFAAVTAAGRDESPASESQPEPSRVSPPVSRAVTSCNGEQI